MTAEDTNNFQELLEQQKGGNVQIKNMYYYPQKKQALWDNTYRTCDKIYNYYHGVMNEKNRQFAKQQRKWNNSAGKKFRDSKKSKVLNFIQNQKKLLKKRKVERVMLQQKSEQKPSEMHLKEITLNKAQLDNKFRIWQARMVRNQRKYNMGDAVLNNINNNTNKNLKIIATKKVLQMDEFAINNISQNFLKQKALQEFHNDILQQHRQHLREKLANTHQKIFEMEKRFGIHKRFKRQRKLYKTFHSGGRSATTKTRKSLLTTKKGRKAKKSQSTRIRLANSQQKTPNVKVENKTQQPFQISFSDVNNLEDNNSQLTSPRFSRQEQQRRTSFDFQYKSGFRRTYAHNPYYDALATPKNKGEGFTMRINPLQHKDFKGLLLSEIDDRILHKDSFKGERMFQKKQTYKQIMQRDQIVRPSSQASKASYTPREIHNFFKTRGSDAWKSEFKSKIRSMNGSQASKQWSASRMANSRRPISQEQLTDSVNEELSCENNQLLQIKNNSSTRKNIDNLITDMDVFEQRFKSAKHFKKRGYPYIQLEAAKKSEIRRDKVDYKTSRT